MYGLKLFWLTSSWRVYQCVCDDWQLCLIACILIDYTLATEVNVDNIPVCAYCNHFPIT